MSESMDALPCIDTEYVEEIDRVAVSHLIRDECERYKPNKNYLGSLTNLPPLDMDMFLTDLMKSEFSRLESGNKEEGLSMKRYELPMPPASRTNDYNAWKECLDNSYAQLEHQAIRIENLELMSVYGPEAWRVHNKFLTKLVTKARKELDVIRKETQELNLQRFMEQTQAAENIQISQNKWAELVMKNYNIELACAQLEEELKKSENNSEAK